MLNYTKASINKANNSRHLLPVLFAYVFQLAISFRDPRLSLPTPTYLLLHELILVRIFSYLFVWSCKSQWPCRTPFCCVVVFTNALPTPLPSGSPTVRGVRFYSRPHGAEMNSKLFTKASGAWFFLLLLLSHLFSFWEKRRNFERHFFFLPAHNLACIAWQMGHGDSLPISRPDRLCRVRHQAFAREKMRRNKIRRRFNVINHTG